MITIEKATVDDFEIINDLAKRIWPIAYKEVISIEQIDYMLNMMYSIEALKQQFLNNHQFILIKDSEYLGFAAYQFDCNEKGKTKLHKLYVLSNQQGKGLGRELVKYIINDAKRNHQKAIFLNVNKKNNAIQFYKHNDFNIAFEEVIDIGNGFVMDDFIMEREL
jgi:diamine N-acetyltransferase